MLEVAKSLTRNEGLMSKELLLEPLDWLRRPFETLQGPLVRKTMLGARWCAAATIVFDESPTGGGASLWLGLPGPSPEGG